MGESRVVTFTTDFGLQDPFVGIMHGVVLSIHPHVHIVDICHAVPSFDLLDGAWTLVQSYRYFPPQTVHVVVIDPGVGSARRPIVAETENYLFVAPDNGVLSLVEARESRFTVRHIVSESYFLQPVSQTFHGRDIFSPVAAWLSKGVTPAEFGPVITDFVRLPIPRVERLGGNGLRGAVIRVDKFGNLVTNLTAQDVPALSGARPRQFEFLISGKSVVHLRGSYAEGAEDEIFVIAGSSGYLEIAANRASAAEKLQAGAGAEVRVVVY